MALSYEPMKPDGTGGVWKVNGQTFAKMLQISSHPVYALMVPIPGVVFPRPLYFKTIAEAQTHVEEQYILRRLRGQITS